VGLELFGKQPAWGDRLLLYFAAVLSAKPSSKIVDQGSDLVGDTGIEPVTPWCELSAARFDGLHALVRRLMTFIRF
jgi:hypothetical protein